VVWRRMAYFGDATAHASILGVALALAFGISVFAGALVVALIIFGQMAIPWFFASLPLVGLLMVFTTGIAFALSAANVFFRDINYLWGIVAQILFYSSPILYTPDLIANDTLRALTNWGPLGSFVRAFHEMYYDGRMPGLGRWAHLTVIAFGTFAVGAWIFNRLSPRFAEEM